jgi:DNA-binding PadR family transcriptional regulator
MRDLDRTPQFYNVYGSIRSRVISWARLSPQYFSKYTDRLLGKGLIDIIDTTGNLVDGNVRKVYSLTSKGLQELRDNGRA